MAGVQEGAADLGTGALPYRGMTDVIVGKFSSTGAPIFAQGFGSSSNEAPAAVATDVAGNVWLAGYTEGATDFGNGPISHAGRRNAFLAGLSPSGALLSAAGYGTNAEGTGIATDAMGHVLATGYFRDTLTFGGPALATGSADDQVFLARLAP